MGSEHLDRQPPRDPAEEREQDELMRGGAEGAASELPTSTPAEREPDPSDSDDEGADG